MGWRDEVETGDWSGVESGEWRVESGVEGRRCVVMESGRREKREKREGKEEGVVFFKGGSPRTLVEPSWRA